MFRKAHFFHAQNVEELLLIRGIKSIFRKAPYPPSVYADKAREKHKNMCLSQKNVRTFLF